MYGYEVLEILKVRSFGWKRIRLVVGYRRQRQVPQLAKLRADLITIPDPRSSCLWLKRMLFSSQDSKVKYIQKGLLGAYIATQHESDTQLFYR